MNFGPRIFRAGLLARKKNRITLTLIFISHRAEIPGRKIRGPKFRAPVTTQRSDSL
jgi:hypothetical protein